MSSRLSSKTPVTAEREGEAPCLGDRGLCIPKPESHEGLDDPFLGKLTDLQVPDTQDCTACYIQGDRRGLVLGILRHPFPLIP